MFFFFFVGVKFPNQAGSITFISKGLTAGLLSVSEIAEEKPGAAATGGEAVCVKDEVTIDDFVLFFNFQTIWLIVITESVWSHGNEDKNASLDLFMKTSNPTLILLAGLFY